jgi:hypothetical protein
MKTDAAHPSIAARGSRWLAVTAGAIAGPARALDAVALAAVGQALVVVAAAVGMAYFAPFTAEDAYITYRYAENLVVHGALVYNLGEPINALTSPLHALVSAALFWATGQTVLGNKVLAVVLLLGAAGLVWRRFRSQPHAQLLALVLVLLPPSVTLWTFGGLETPLLLCLVTLATCLAARAGPFSLGRLAALGFLAGLAFLTRYDSSLFFLPLLLHAAARARAARHVLLAGLLAAVLPLAWLGLSLWYYGDLLPTSFYVKTPTASPDRLVLNGLYVGTYLVYVGAVPVLALAVFWLRSDRVLGRVLRSVAWQWWWLCLGLLLELAYSLTAATHHMMFSFRLLVPYLPALALLGLDLLGRAYDPRAAGPNAARRGRMLAGLVLCLAAFQISQSAYTYTRSVNGLALAGEYRALSLREYVQFMRLLRQEAFDIEAHWQTLPASSQRPPRVLTYAAGILPYAYRDTYVYEKLVSFRHCHTRHNQALHADYIHLLAPRHGAVAQQLPGPVGSFVLVSAYAMVFDGSPQQFLVYFNPQPAAHNLSANVGGHCPGGSALARTEADDVRGE